MKSYPGFSNKSYHCALSKQPQQSREIFQNRRASFAKSLFKKVYEQSNTILTSGIGIVDENIQLAQENLNCGTNEEANEI